MVRGHIVLLTARRPAAACVALAFGVVLATTPALAFGRKSDICTSANNYCNGPPARSSTPTYRAPPPRGYSTPHRPARPVRRGPSRAEIERRRKAAEATRLNKLGIGAWNVKNWGSAVRFFEAALVNSPTNPVIKKNLDKARAELRWEQQRKKDARETEEAKARINRMLGGLADELARPPGASGMPSIFDSAAGPEGFPTPTGRVGMIDIFDAPPPSATVPATPPPTTPAKPIDFGAEKPPLFSKGTSSSAPVALGPGALPTINPGDLKGSERKKGVKFKEVPPPKISKPLFDAEGWRLDANGQRIPGSRQIWSDKYKAYVDEFGRIRRNWPGPTKNPEGRLPNPLAEERERELKAESKMMGDSLKRAIVNHDRTRVWPGPTRNPEGRLPNPLADVDGSGKTADLEPLSESLMKALLNRDRTRVWPGPTREQAKSASGQ